MVQQRRAGCSTWLDTPVTAADFRAARHALGLSQAALAEKLGLSKDQVSRIERGVYRVSRLHELALYALQNGA